MSQYVVIIKEEAQEDLKRLLRNEPKAYKKALRFIAELYDHPKTGFRSKASPKDAGAER